MLQTMFQRMSEKTQKPYHTNRPWLYLFFSFNMYFFIILICIFNQRKNEIEGDKEEKKP